MQRCHVRLAENVGEHLQLGQQMTASPALVKKFAVTGKGLTAHHVWKGGKTVQDTRQL
jgi:hypothetical protein